MADRDEITTFCNELLGVYAFDDYGPQGMQFIGSKKVSHIVTAVSVNADAIKRAKKLQANMLIVHHGLFWRTEPRVLDIQQDRMDALEEAGISLLGYHLCLDANPEIGNNILAAKAMGVVDPQPFADIGWGGKIIDGEKLTQRVAKEFHGNVMKRFPGGDHPPKSACVMTGKAGNYLREAAQEGYDLFLTGEAEENSQALAKELGITMVAAGHHNTEKSGVKALGQKLAKEFEVQHTFINVANPV